MIGPRSSRNGSERDILAKLHFLMMRRIALILAAIAIAATAGATTLASIGAVPSVYAPLSEKNVAIPFRFTGSCTPFLEIHLVSGEVRLYYGGHAIFKADQPGWYRVLLPAKSGAVTLQLRRRSYENAAIVDPNGSFVACARVPVVDMNASVPKIWKKGGFTHIYITLRNRGTAPAKIYINIQDPRTSAHLPTKQVQVPAGAEKTERITMVTARETNRSLLLPICAEYSDQYGEQKACTDFYEFRADKNVAVTLIDLNGQYIVMNSGTEDVNIGTVLRPGETTVTHLPPELRGAYVEMLIKMTESPEREVSKKNTLEGIIMGVLGILSLLLSSKTL